MHAWCFATTNRIYKEACMQIKWEVIYLSLLLIFRKCIISPLDIGILISLLYTPTMQCTHNITGPVSEPVR